MPKTKRPGKFYRVALDFDEDQLDFLSEYGQKTYRTRSDVIRYAIGLLMRKVKEENGTSVDI